MRTLLATSVMGDPVCPVDHMLRALSRRATSCFVPSELCSAPLCFCEMVRQSGQFYYPQSSGTAEISVQDWVERMEAALAVMREAETYKLQQTAGFSEAAHSSRQVILF